MSILQIFIDDTGGSPTLHTDPTDPADPTRTHRTSSRLTNQPTLSVPSQRRTFVHQGEIFHFRSSSSAPLSVPSLLSFRTFSNISSFLPAASVNVLRLRSTVQHPAADLSSSLVGKQAPFPRPVNNVRRVVCCCVCVCVCVRVCAQLRIRRRRRPQLNSIRFHPSLSPASLSPSPTFHLSLMLPSACSFASTSTSSSSSFPPLPSYTPLQATHTHTFVCALAKENFA